MGKSHIIILFITLLFPIQSWAQCDVRIYADKEKICIGDTIGIKALGGCGIVFFVDFNDSTLQGLLTNSTTLIGSPCTPQPDHSHYLWLGTQTGQNTVYTPQLNLSSGGYTIYFDMIYGSENASGICNGPSLPTEKVNLQYSINNGASWTTLQSWNPNGGNDPNLTQWDSYTIPLPLAANINGVRIRWAQDGSINANTANWGIDNIRIQKYIPTTFLWSTGYSGNIHPDISPNNSTQYTVTATSIYSSASDSLVIDVNPRPTAHFTTSRPLCKNMPISLIHTGAQDSTNVYTWNVEQAQQLIDSTKATAQAIWNETGQYTVSLSIKNAYCTSFPVTKELLIEPLISFYISSSQGCVPLSVSFTGNVKPPTVSYLWDFKDGGTSNVANPVHTYTLAGDYGLSLIAITDSGCADTADFALLTKVFPLPQPDFNWSPSIVPWSNPVASFTNLTNGNNTYLWNFGDPASGANTDQNTNPNHDFSAKGLFDVMLLATSDKGCQDSIIKTIRVADDEFSLPNVITPNNDGYNETLTISNLESLKYCHLEIFNRWGKLVYINNNYKNDWDASQIAEGVYYYFARYESWFGKEEAKGFFHIIRKN
jgi:gliding motility-associated-like protein